MTSFLEEGDESLHAVVGDLDISAQGTMSRTAEQSKILQLGNVLPPSLNNIHSMYSNLFKKNPHHNPRIHEMDTALKFRTIQETEISKTEKSWMTELIKEQPDNIQNQVGIFPNAQGMLLHAYQKPSTLQIFLEEEPYKNFQDYDSYSNGKELPLDRMKVYVISDLIEKFRKEQKAKIFGYLFGVIQGDRLVADRIVIPSSKEQAKISSQSITRIQEENQDRILLGYVSWEPERKDEIINDLQYQMYAMYKCQKLRHAIIQLGPQEDDDRFAEINPDDDLFSQLEQYNVRKKVMNGKKCQKNNHKLEILITKQSVFTSMIYK